jgi:glucuronoarabinoxylan endo-1,4-beta-xylanase
MIKNFPRHFAFFVGAFIFITLPNLNAANTVVVANGDFEAGYSNGWNHLAGNGGSAAYSDETSSPYQGSHALKVVVNTLGSNSWDVQSLGPTVSLTVGKEYELSFWGKSAVTGTSFRTVIQNTVYTAKLYSLSNNWTRYTWKFTALETSPSIRLRYPELGTVWIDDIRLEEVVPDVGPVTITVSPEIEHQTMVGFGGALTWYSSWMYNGTKADEINQLMFDDLGLDILRLKNWYYPANYPAQTTMDSANSFEAAKKFYDAAKAINPDIQVLLSSWSPPANLKSNGERDNGGTLTKDASGNFQYSEFAQYWVDCLDNLGWTPDFLSFQNEPGWVASWESCIFDPTETATNAGYAEAADAIWNAIKDRPNVPKLIGSEAENTNAFFDLNPPLLAKPYIAAHAYHNYNIGNEAQIDSASTIEAFNTIRDSFGDRPNWMTEHSRSDFDWITAAKAIHSTVSEANASAYIYWTLAWSDSDPGYMIGLTSSDFSSYKIGPHFYMLKHYAKHVDKGYKRIETAGSNSNIKVTGFLSEDRESITLVAINSHTSMEQLTLNYNVSISGIEGYQSVVDNYYQAMTGLDTANSIDLPAESMTTLVLTLTTPLNTAPTVDAGEDQTVALTSKIVGELAVVESYYEWDASQGPSRDWPSTTANAYAWTFGSSQIPVTVSDTRFDLLTKAYALPDTKATGDTFQGNGDSENATFEFVLDVDSTNGVIFETGGGWVGTQFDVHGGQLRFLVQPGENIAPYTLSVALTEVDTGRFVHVVGVLDLSTNEMLLYLDGTLVDSIDNFAHDDWSDDNSAGLGRSNGDGASTGATSGLETGDFTGEIALFRYYKNKAFTAAEVTANFNSLSTDSSAVVTLDATVTDPDQTPTTTWTRVGGTGAGDVVFEDASAVDTTATFTEVGTYVFRLTAYDGEAQISNDITITVDPDPPANYTAWADNTFTNPFNEIGVNQDPDGDGVINQLEFGFGMDPTLNASSSLLVEGSLNGLPVAATSDGGGTFDFFFIRRDDHGTSGSLNYIVQFSSDLGTFYDSDVTPTFVIDSANTHYEVVKVAYPEILPNGQKATFGRIELTRAP